ncbi:MAG: FecR domain-containing protein [Chitinophagaceae bacterium]|nr:FecR domain-containing protein [Chitinophagaceae bacterium]MCW5928263.1 FecR domain-containing protein [Chitinophagaceae bacterium]
MTEQQQIALLLYKYLQASLTETEALRLENWKAQSEANRHFFDALQDEDQLSRWIAGDYPGRLQDTEESIYVKVLHQIPALRITPLYRRSWFRVAVAASVLFIVGLTYWLGVVNKPTETTDEIVHAKEVNDIEAPSVTKATITLANGNTIAVDSLTAITQGNVQLSKTADGKIVYLGDANEVVYNTLTNPRGSRVIDITLSDGSQVWLNAGSSITYPVAFAGTERVVSMSGEAYFEVAHYKNTSFKVIKNATEIEVLGTRFNVNAYDDEALTKVTLLEGSVEVSNGRIKKILQPGEQAWVAQKISVEKDVDIEEIMAWKNGKFIFSEKTNIETIMQQVARWYDVDVEYRGKIHTDFGGAISRQVNVSEVLRILEETGRVKCELEDRKIIITP